MKKIQSGQFSQLIGFKPEVFGARSGVNQQLGGSHNVPLQGSASYPTNPQIPTNGWSNNFPSGSNYPQHISSQITQPFVPSQQPGIGQIAKEAVVHATVNQAVNRIINGSPRQHHHYDTGTINSSPPLSTFDASRPSTSDVTVNNYYGEASSVVPLNLTELAIITSSTETPTYNLYGDPKITALRKVMDDQYLFIKNLYEKKSKLLADGGSTTKNLMNLNSNERADLEKLIYNRKDDDGTSLTESRYNISREKIENVTETLFTMEEYRLDNFILYNLQEKTNSTNITNQVYQK